MLRRFGIIVAAGALAAGGMVVSSVPALAATTVLTCTSGSGNAHLAPGIGATPAQQTISDPANVAGCSGSEAGTITHGTNTFSNLKTQPTGSPPAQPQCSTLGNVVPAGTIVATGGVISTKWFNSANAQVATSAGSLKLKGTGVALQVKAIIKITSGKFFVSGHTTKAKVAVNFSLHPGQTCPTLQIVDTTDAGNLNVTRV